MTKILDLALEHPVASLAILAAIVGAAGGSLLGARRRQGPADSVRQMAASAPSLSTARSGLSLVPIALQLLSNPLVRYLLRRAVSRAIARQLGR